MSKRSLGGAKSPQNPTTQQDMKGSIAFLLQRAHCRARAPPASESFCVSRGGVVQALLNQQEEPPSS